MPSGSHRGRPGSHRGGGGSRRSGSSSGGSSYRGSSHRSSRRGWHTRGAHYFFFGRRRYYVSERRSSAMSLLGVLLVFAIFVGIVGLVFSVGGNSDIGVITGDFLHYQEMIANAEQNPNRIKTATVTDCFQSDNSDKYYIEYKIQTDDGSGMLVGYSYSVYTRQQAMALLESQIMVATNASTVTQNTDSIPMDYKSMTLEDDGEYTNAKQLVSIGGFMLVGGGVVVAGSIVGQIVLAFSSKASGTEYAENSQSFSANSQKVAEERHCKYCGARMSDSDKKCPSCGSSGR